MTEQSPRRTLARDPGATATYLLRGSTLRVTTSIVAALVGFFMMPFLIGRLGEHNYGIWVVATSLVGTYYLLDFGLSASVMRFAAMSVGTGDVVQLSRVVSTALGIYLALALAILLVSLGLGAWAPQWNVAAGDASDFRHVILVTGISMAIGFPFKAYAGILQARLRYDLMSTIGLASTLVGALSTVILVTWGYGIVALAYVGLVTSLLTDFLFLSLARREAPGLVVRRTLFDASLVRELASFSAWSFLIQMSNQLRFRIDALVIGSIRTAADVTRYSVGARLSEIPDGMLYQATNLVQPLLTGYHAVGDRHSMLKALALYSRVNTILGVFAAGMLLIMGEAFIHRWMGTEYSVSASVLYVLALSRCLGFITNPLDNSLYAIGRIKRLALINVLDALLNVAASIWLGLRYGIVGVAFGTMIPMVLTRVFLVVPNACRQLNWPLWRYSQAIGRPLLVGVAMLTAFWFAYRHMAWPQDGYLSMLTFALLSGTLYVVVAWRLGLSAPERALVADALGNAYHRRRARQTPAS